jgi:hypothetical protein
VQFVDGDCELLPGWLELGQRAVLEKPDAAAVAGRLRERYPERSLYNRLCDIEWNTPPGEVRYVGGVCMVNAAAFERSGGFNPGMVAGEEPELCVRLRNAGGRIYRLPEEMAVHDADMHRFGQWWKRAVRAGYAYGLAAQYHGRAPERLKIHEIRSSLVWAVGVPLCAAACALASLRWPWAWLGVFVAAGLYTGLWTKVYHLSRRQGLTRCEAAWNSAFCLLSKWAHVQGLARWWYDRRLRRQPAIIEYKSFASGRFRALT